MILSGWMLWREDARSRPTWVEGTWEVRDGRIERLQGRSVPAGTDHRGWMVPGMVDVHCHIGVGAEGPVGTARQVQQARADRDSGVLALRDCGAPVDNSWMKGRRDMPVLIRAGRHVARPGRYIRGMAVELEDPGELPQELVRQAHGSDGWVKIVADWIDRSRGAEADLEPLWPPEVLVDAVAAAHGAGARVAAHCFSHTAVDALLEAGVDDIEHGCGMDEDQVAEAVRRGVYVTPTLLQVELFEGFARQGARRYPRYARTMADMYARRREHAEMLLASEVHLLPGTDAGGYQDHGSLTRELALWHRCGMEPTRVVDLATWQAREAMGLDSLHPGAPADLVVLDGDPREDLCHLDHARAVLLRGEVVAGSALR